MSQLGRQREYVSTEDIAPARQRLSEFVLWHELQTMVEVGFGWMPCADAPSTFDGLQESFARSVATGEPLPISSKNSASVIFTSPSVNMSQRFVHDVHHVRLGLSFGLIDELELALWHLDQLQAVGFARDSLEHSLFHADLVGQVLVNALGRRFPSDQELFGLDCARLGFDHGILAELRRSA
jgi:hypothetical protein